MYIIIVGCGRLGSNLARKLSDDYDVCIIDRDAEKLEELGSGFNGQKIRGIEYDSDILVQAGIEQADSVLVVTSDDNINITTSLIAEKIYHTPKIISRVNNPGKKVIYDQLGINTINPINYEYDVLKSKLNFNSADIITTLDDNYNIFQVSVVKERPLIVKSIEDKFSCIISAIIKGGVVSLPNENDQIKKGDRIICTMRQMDAKKLIKYINGELLI